MASGQYDGRSGARQGSGGGEERARLMGLVHAATVDIVAASADPQRDMREERARASFHSENLAAFMNGGEVGGTASLPVPSLV